MFYRDSSFFRPLICELAERNLTIYPATWSEVGVIWKYVQNLGYRLPYKSGAPKPPFSTISQLNGNFSGLHIRNETRYKQSGKCVAICKGSSYIVSKRHRLRYTNG